MATKLISFVSTLIVVFLMASCGDELCKPVSASELRGLSNAIQKSIQADPAFSAYEAFKNIYREALDTASGLQGYSETPTRETWKGDHWAPAANSDFPPGFFDSYHSGFTFPTGEFFGTYMVQLQPDVHLFGNGFELYINQHFGGRVESTTSLTLKSGWEFEFAEDRSGYAKFPGGLWVLGFEGIQDLFLDHISFTLPGYRVRVQGKPKKGFTVTFNGREACPSDAKAVVSLFPDVATLLSLTFKPYSYTTPVEWLDQQR